MTRYETTHYHALYCVQHLRSTLLCNCLKEAKFLVKFSLHASKLFQHCIYNPATKEILMCISTTSVTVNFEHLYSPKWQQTKNTNKQYKQLQKHRCLCSIRQHYITRRSFRSPVFVILLRRFQFCLQPCLFVSNISGKRLPLSLCNFQQRRAVALRLIRQVTAP